VGEFRFNCGVSASVRVQLKDGSYHEVDAISNVDETIQDIGYGVSENQRGKGAALEKVTFSVDFSFSPSTFYSHLSFFQAKKEAVTDATKRTLRLFGHSLGNCIHDKEYLKFVKRVPEVSVNRNKKFFLDPT
jgi:recombination DNA repair RAD52 pathway protein